MASPAAETEPRRFVALDGVRGLAILMVVFWHFYACVPRPEWVTTIPALEKLAGYTWTGVPLFFVLSGFLIGRILIRQRGEAGYYRVFFVRRAARILPLYFVALAAFLIVRDVLPPTQHPVLERLFASDAPEWSYAVFVQNLIMALHGNLGGEWLSVTWSLAVEEQFYLLLPFLVAVISPAALPRAMLVLVAGAFAFRWVALMAEAGTPTAIITLLPSRIDAFALGIFVACQRRRLARAMFARRMIAVGGVIGCAALVYVGRSASPWYLASYYTFIAMAFTLLLWHLTSSERGRLSAVFSSKPLRWLGSVSYFVYLFHQPSNSLLHFGLRAEAPNLANGTGVLVTALAFGLVLVAAEASRRWFEGPIVAWGKRWQYGAAAGAAGERPARKPAAEPEVVMR